MAVKLRRTGGENARTVRVDNSSTRSTTIATFSVVENDDTTTTNTTTKKVSTANHNGTAAAAATAVTTTNPPRTTTTTTTATTTKTATNGTTTSTTRTSTTRYASIDVLRALSQTQMILVHFVDFWSGGKWQHKYYEYEIMDVVMWLLLSGISFHITSTSTLNRSYNNNSTSNNKDGMQRVRQQSLRRGMFFTLLHLFVTLVIIQDPVHAYMCDTLVLLGISQVVLSYVCAWKSTTAVIVSGVSILLLTAPVQYDWFWSKYWIFDGEGEYNHTINLERYDLYDKMELMFDMILCNGIFPIFPYLGYPLIGLGLGRLLYPVQNKYEKHQQEQQQSPQSPQRTNATKSSSSSSSSPDETVQVAMKYILRVGLFLVTLSASLIVYGKMDPSIVKRSHQWRWLMLDGYGMELGASFEYIWGSLGKDLIWIVLAKRIFDTAATAKDRSSVKSTFVSVASQMSRTSLTMYILHHAVIFMVIRGLEWWEDEDFDEYHGDVFAENPMYSIYIGLTFFVVSQYVLSWMEQRKIPMVESLLRWFCKATTFSSSLLSSKISSVSPNFKKKEL